MKTKPKTYTDEKGRFVKGIIPWNKGKKGFLKYTDEQKKTASERVKKQWATGKRVGGWKLSQESRDKIAKGHIGLSTKWLTGMVKSIETRRKLSETHKRLAQQGLNHFWKGGITKENSIIRGSLDYKLWRESVFKRDKYTCVMCGAKNGLGKRVNLNADHIKPFAFYPELRFEVDNGRTLCIDCHKTTDTYMGRAHKHKKSCEKMMSGLGSLIKLHDNESRNLH